MVKKQNNNVWIVYVLALIAIVALVLGAVALNRANMTGNIFWDKWFDNPEPDGLVGGECEQPAFDNCVSECEGGDPDLYWDCMGDCGALCPDSLADRGALEIYFIAKGGNPDVLNNYVNTITYFDEATQSNVKVSQIIGGPDAYVGHTITCTGSCTGNGCNVNGCDVETKFDCSECSCLGGGSCSECTCSRALSQIGSLD